MSEALLEDRDYTIIVAKTIASLTKTPPGFEKRWLDAYESVLTLARTCETFDPDGITVYLSSSDQANQFQCHKQVKSEQLAGIFEAHYPPETIDLLNVLERALDDYWIRKAARQTKPNGEMILVLTDGEPSDSEGNSLPARMAISRLVVHATEKLERDNELGIGFVQIGDDLIARGFLAALDQNLESAGAKFDIVHTEVLEEVKAHSLTEFLLRVFND